MKKILLISMAAVMMLTANAQSDSAKTYYQYYMIEARPTGKLQIEVWPERSTFYPDIDSLIVEKREKNKKGVEEIEPKKYSSMSEFFNSLASAGLEFVNYYKWNMAGGLTGMMVGRVESDFFIFRKQKK